MNLADGLRKQVFGIQRGNGSLLKQSPNEETPKTRGDKAYALIVIIQMGKKRTNHILFANLDDHPATSSLTTMTGAYWRDGVA